MAESFTSYTVDNDRRFRNALKEVSAVSTDLRIPFGLILRDFYKSEQSIFSLKGPGKYPAISKKYGDQKQKLVGFRYPLLVRTGALAASLLGPNNKGSVSKITNLSLTFGTAIKYGIYHQSDASRSKIPLRKFLFIGPEAPRFANSEQQGRLERWVGYISDHMKRETKKAGLGG